MKKIISTILILISVLICNAQSVQTKYYNNSSLEKEVSPEKAKFMKTVTKNPDESEITEIKNIKTGLITHSYTYRGEEPFGIWVTGDVTKTLDFDFRLQYTDEKCPENIPAFSINNYFQDIDSIGYKAPIIASGEKSIEQFLCYNIKYPVRAIENEIKGKVELTFTISTEGNIENICILHSVNIGIDKEAVRVLRKLKFSKPATINGKPISLCVTFPVEFRIE